MTIPVRKASWVRDAGVVFLMVGGISLISGCGATAPGMVSGPAERGVPGKPMEGKGERGGGSAPSGVGMGSVSAQRVLSPPPPELFEPTPPAARDAAYRDLLGEMMQRVKMESQFEDQGGEQ
jgi:hypothetical protein